MVASTLWRGNPAKLARHGDFRGSWERRDRFGRCEYRYLFQRHRWVGRLRQAGANWAHRGWSRGSTSFGLGRRFGKRKAASLRAIAGRGSARGSKAFCKNVLRQADVPTADFQVFRDPDDAMRYIKGKYPGENDRCPVVVKADGLASGKGVIVCKRRSDALDAIDRISRRKEFGIAGSQMVIEDRLEGQEASILAITDGRTILPLPAAQDHKPAFDGDTGPNTGGMGAYCPTPMVDDSMLAWIEEHVLVPTVHTMKRNRKPFKGVLYAGLMLTQAGPKVLEYNCRFGDPECQPLLMRLKSDLVEILEAVVDGNLDQIDGPEWDPPASACCHGQPRISRRISNRTTNPWNQRSRSNARRQSLSRWYQVS